MEQKRTVTLWIYTLVFLWFINLPVLFADTYDSPLAVAGVQLEVNFDIYESQDAFQEYISSIVRSVMEMYAPDIIVFPEYTNVFLALLPYIDTIKRADTYEQGLKSVLSMHPSIAGLKQLFLREADAVQTMMQQIWGGLADAWDITIIAGTYFARSQQNDDSVEGLRNRALVYSPSGECMYRQDKVYLTEFEKSIVGLSPGDVESARLFPVKGKPIGITICRDTFFRQWEFRFDAAFLWIDLKANGTLFTDIERERFKTALPERLEHANIDYGLTVCLTGTFLDLLWEGESSLIKNTSEGVVTLVETENPKGGDILFYLLKDER